MKFRQENLLPINRQKIIENISTLFSGSIIAQGMTLLALLITARQLGASQYGQFAACFVLAGLSSIIFSLGFDIWMLREGGRAPHLLNSYTGSVLIIKLFLGILWLLLISYLTNFLNNDTYPSFLLKLVALSVWADSIFNTILTSFKASLKNRITSILESSSDTLWFISTLFLAWLGNNQPEAFVLVRVVVLIPSIVIALIIVYQTIGLSFSTDIIKQTLMDIFPFASSEFLAWASMRVDVLIISFALGKTAVGIYSPAVGLINMAFLVPSAVYMVMVPVLSNLFPTNYRQATITSQRMIVFMVIIGLALSSIFYFGAGFIVPILGKSYSASVGILRILSILLLLKSLTFAFASIIVADGKQQKRVVVQFVAVFTNILMNIWVITRFGLSGVAIVYILTEAIILLGYFYIANKTSPTTMSSN